MIIYKILISLVIIFHLAFILYVVLGGLLVFVWKRSIFFHIPAVLWGAWVEYMNFICPLTPLENYFRKMACFTTYSAGFIDQYITPIIYPENLQRNMQIIFGSLVVIINAIIYILILYKLLKNRESKK